eukprot:SAG11_NODE_1067_length_5980_cov_2.560109_1_plen_426_part_00
MCLGLMITFLSVLTTVRAMPYADKNTNRYKILLDINLFFTFLCVLMLKINMAGEFLSPQFFDWTMTISNLCIGALPAVLAVGRSMQIMLRNINRTLEMVNREEVARLALVGLIEAQPKKTLEHPVDRAALETMSVKALTSVCIAHGIDRKEVVNAKATLGETIAKGSASCCQLLKKFCSESEDGIKTLTALLFEFLDDLENEGRISCDSTLDEQPTAEEDPENEEEAAAAAIAILMETLRPELEKRLQKLGLTWTDIQPSIALIDSIEKLQDAIAKPDEFLKQFFQSMGPAAIRALFRPKIESVLVRWGITWDDALPALQLIDTVEEIQEAIENPDQFLKKLLKAMGPVAICAIFAKLRPKLEPLLTKNNVAWDDALPALQLIDTVEEIQDAIEKPGELVDRVLKSVGSQPADEIRNPKDISLAP